MLSGSAVLLSCATEPCACPPSRSHLVVTGTVNRASTGLAGATIGFQEQIDDPCDTSGGRIFNLETQYGEQAGVQTDDTGAFHAHLYSYFTPIERCVIVTVAADNDTVRVRQPALFRHERETPETIHVGVMLNGP